VSAASGSIRTVVVQDRSRLFRESLGILLEQDGAAAQVLTAGDDLDCREALSRHPDPVAVVFEAVGVPWDVVGLVEEITRTSPGAEQVGTFAQRSRPTSAVEGVRYVRRSAHGSAFARAVRGEEADPSDADDRSSEGGPENAAALSPRELQVLALISGGLTTQAIAERLGISTKTVEGRRETLFAKLGVQSQVQAVAVAMRTGLLSTAPAAAGEW
jgi:DNA-binding NarL/FixJ family response regulator